MALGRSLGSKVLGLVIGLMLSAVLSTVGNCASPTLVAQPGVTAPASIPELARALKNDANLIYEYVYTNIDYSPIYGVKKGALGTLLDGHGNDFDQAALLVALLRQAGYTANYVYGKITLTAAQFHNWFGVDTSTACPLANLLAEGGFPVSVPNCNVPFSTANLPHVWVTATGGSLGTQTYVFDPSFKTYTTTTGINLASAMGYNQASYLSLAENGATINPNSIQGVNSGNIHTALTGYANNLAAYIRANMPTATLKDVIGGKYIQPITQPYSPGTSLPYETPGDTPVTWTDIPNVYRTTMEVQIGGIDQTYYADQIYGHRLSLVYDSSAQPVLYLDGVVQGTGTANATTINYNVDFPFCFPTTGTGSTACNSTGGVNYTNVFTFQNVVKAGNGFTYAIVNGWDFTGRGMLDFHRRQLQINRAAGGSTSSEAVLGETLNMIGYSWLAQLSAVNDVADRIIGSKVVTQCAIGVVGQVTGPYIDMPGGFVGASSLTTDTNRANTAFFTDGGHLSALEWGTLDQNLSKENIGAVSTIKLLDIANTSNLVLYDATASNWSTIQASLSNYNSGDLATIQNTYINNGYRVILPQKGNLTQNGWTGVGYLAIGTNAVGTTTITYKISSNLKGGYPDDEIDSEDVVPAVEETDPEIPPPPQVVSNEPIDLATGAFLYDRDDLSVGSSGTPFGLTFHRSYSSNNRHNAGPLGNGWTHSFSINAIVNSDGLRGLGEDSPIDGAAAIAEVYVAQDLLSDTAKPLTKMVVASLSQRWFMDQLINNTVNVAIASQTEQFVRLADGGYHPQLGSTDRLSLNGEAYTLQNKDGTTLNFNADGNISTWNSPSGVSISFAYNSASPPLLTSVSNNLGRSLALNYNGAGQIASVADNTGRGVSYGYDSAGNLNSFVDPNGNTTTFSYQASGLLGEVFYPSLQGRAFVTNSYDTLGRVATQANANGVSWNYYFAGYRSEEDDAYGTRHVLYYNPRGKVQFDIQDIDGLDRVTTSSYDGLDRLTATTMPEGNSLAYTYDGANNPWANNIAIVTRNQKPGSPLSPTTQSFTYNPTWNKPASATDALGKLTTYHYDAGGNVMQIVADAGAAPHLNATTTKVYDGFGKVVFSTDPTGVVTKSQYDTFENLISSIADYGAGHLNLTTGYAYDAAGNIVAKTDPNGNATTMSYDAARRLLTSTAPAPFNLGPSLVQTINGYDADGHLVSVTRTNASANQVTQTSYTPTGKTQSVTDPNGNTTTNTYDLDDRLQSVSQPVSLGVKRVTSFSYDTLSRLATVVDNTGNTAEQYAYKPNGKQASFTDARGNVTSYTYDGFDRLSLTTYPIGSTGTHTTESRTYDAADNVLSRTTRAGATISFAYDTLNRLCSKTIATSPTACAATSSASPTVFYGYDLNGRLTSAADNSAAITAAVPGTPPSYAMTYGYDQLNRPVIVSWSPAVAFTAPTASTVTFGHTYNGVNQRIGQTATDNSWLNYPAAVPSVVSYTANAINQYTAVGSVSPTYDGNGNLTSDGTFTFGYDAENRLISASGAGNTVAYVFDAQGRRKSKTVNGTTTIFVTDADNREVLEYDGASGAILRWYAYGLKPNDVVNQTNLAAATRAALVPDVQGSIIGSLDSGSGVLTRTGYLPYGQSAGTTPPFAYTAQRIDPETNGLYYYRGRHYKPAWGRFLQPDPSGYQGGRNLYAYVNNDPLNGTDRRGLAKDNNSNAEDEEDEVSYVFRGVETPPDTVFNQGFTAKGDSMNLLGHASDSDDPPSAYISTSKSADIASTFGSYVYVIRTPSNAIDVNAVLGDASPYSGELEMVVPGSISGSQVRAVTIPGEGISFLNPGYVP